MARMMQKVQKIKVLPAVTTKKKIQTAEIRKGLADARVKNDKWMGAYAEYTGPQASAMKAKNVRKAVDASKTAGRAKNVASKLKKM